MVQIGRDGQGAPPLSVPKGFRVGDWTVTGLIGSGGWGSVYAAEGPDGARVAVKFLRTGLLTPGQLTSMDELVKREVEFSLAARHPNLVRAHAALTVNDGDTGSDSGSDPDADTDTDTDADSATDPDPRSGASRGLDGAIALVMDRAERSVQDVLAAAEPGTPVPGAERLLRGVSAGLAHLHTRGWVHGDLKPGNILLGPGGEVWLADFGLTAELDGTHAYVPPLGSLDHLPPEWWSERTGSRGTAMRPTSDIWAFGVLAHQVLSGGLHPFPGAGARARALAAQSYARGRAPLRLDGGVPDGWRRLIVDCLAPDHASRSGLDAATLAERVAALESGTDTAAGSAPAPGNVSGTAAAPGGRPWWRRRVPLAAAATALVTAGAVTAVLLTTGGGHHGSGGTGAGVTNDGVPADSDVPVALRPYIYDAAHGCVHPEVTPALIAAMLKAESNFDANARRPSTGEYGIAMWTPSVFEPWAKDGNHDGKADYMSAPDAIATMGVYLCWIDDQLQVAGMHTDMPSLIAASYRTSYGKVVKAGGVPPAVEPYIDKVRRYLADYTR
ncbi:protein kinase [Streptomyces sp. NPDC051976]|uniref:protein kinase domain-containing protein n=1 Tax=Streptomyces sp. NPDC051976 TaxID=3154947 RepID=UPI0034146793